MFPLINFHTKKKHLVVCTCIFSAGFYSVHMHVLYEVFADSRNLLPQFTDFNEFLRYILYLSLV